MRLWLLALAFLLIGLGACKKQNVVPAKEYHLPDIVDLFAIEESKKSPEAYRAFGDTLMSANRDLEASQLYVEAATQYHKAGAGTEMVNALHLAIDKGMANPKIMDQFSGHVKALASEEGNRLFKRLDSIQEQLEQVSHYHLEMRSMEQFWPYFERALADTSKARQELKKYLFEGPPEIRDFYLVRYGNLDMMYGQMINASPDYYLHLKSQVRPDSLLAVQETTRQWMQHFKELYPQAIFPKVYVVPGILNSGGTVTEMGMFIGGDMYGRSNEMPTEGLSDWQKNAIMSFDQLPGITIHELMHFQQNYRDTVNLEYVMGAIIGEGVCDFLVELSSGEQLENDNLNYLEKPENMSFILEELKGDLYNTDNSKWLYNGGSIEDRPQDLGYTLGYLICKSFYENHEDKEQAIYELLNTDNLETIYQGGVFANLVKTNTNETL
ncbi:hypothetical protein [Lentiprolixibacter aurantiacus]|uniref:DUF2268 domain-containing protein n=1 Tax=Lentiprolixibacter aurantiacus TaxID=2993939 RepID=A0AAE3SQ84_9FLAO|nr:hypothetical protein [Lentiprolixibacter aurantiacus]MCX2720257.1 hypothetical protein [Lentiprolixibacter aurantiacus]